MSRPQPAAFGIRSHSGWATLVAVIGSASAGSVVARQRLELIETGVPRQPYHAAEPLPRGRAEALVQRALASAARVTGASLGSALCDAAGRGFEIRAAGLLLGSGRPLPALDGILRSHALIHTAEGEMYRAALRQACLAAGLRVVGIREKELRARGAALLGGEGGLDERLATLGRALGPPWRADEKLAALAAWVALGER